MKLDVWQKDVGIIADFASDAGSATRNPTPARVVMRFMGTRAPQCLQRR